MMRLVLLFTILLGFSSCLKDKYDFDNLNTTGYNPSVAAPLINTDLVLGDLLEKADTTYINTDVNDLLHITYSTDLFSYKVADLISIPSQTISQSFGVGDFSIPDINTGTSITLGNVVGNMNDPEKTNIQSANGNTAPFPAIPAQDGGTFPVPALSGFNSVSFYQGTLTLSITNNWPIQLDNVQIEIRNSVGNSLIGTFNFPSIAASSTDSKNVNLAGVTMSNSLNMVIASFSSPGTFPAAVPIDLTDDLSIGIATANIGVLSASAIFPSQQVVNQTINTNLALTNGEELNTIVLKGGQISYDIDYGIRENAQIILTLPSVKKNNVAFSQTINITSDHINSTNVTGTFDLADYTFDLTNGGLTYNFLPATIQASVISSGQAIPIDTGDVVSAQITIDQLAFSYLEGYLGNQTLNMASDSAAMDFFKSPLGATITLADPKITLKLKNSVGIPMDADLSAMAVKDQNNTLIPFTGIANPLTINSPGVVGQTAITNILIDKNTTNIQQILASNPKEIYFGISGTINPGGKVTNFITDTSSITVSMDLDIPLYGSVSGLSIKDTIAFPSDAFKNVKTASLRSIITSEFPIEANVQMYFMDSTKTVIDSIFHSGYEQVVPSCIVDVNGEMTAASAPKQTDFSVDEAMVEKLKTAKYIIICSKMATANNGATAAKFYAHYKMNVKLGVVAKVFIDIKDKQ